MDSWAFQTGQIDADGNYVDRISAKDDKYWQKYMSDSSPYREKFSPPSKVKSPEHTKPQKRRNGKKKPKWMTNEEYERLMTKSHARKPTGEETVKEEGSYFGNGGEILRWPEVLQQRAHSPAFKHAAKQTESAKQGAQTEGSDLDELRAVHGVTLPGTYRPSSAPLHKGANLFGKQGQGAFLNDLVMTPNALKTNNGAATAKGRQSREVSPTSAGRGRKLKLEDPYTEGVTDEDGIVEYGDTYVIENEEEAIHRIQEAMIKAVARSASPRGRKRTKEERRAGDEEDVKRIGAGLHVAGMI